MRAGLLTVAVLVATASAAPRHQRRSHGHAHKKRAEVIDIETDVVYATAVVAQEIVYVDENGNPISTAYPDSPAAQTSQTPAPLPVSSASVPAEPSASASEVSSEVASPSSQSAASPPPAYTPPSQDVASTTAEQDTTPSPQAAATSTSSSSPPAYSGSSGTTAPSGRGITYTPYNDNGSMKTQDQITSDLASVDGYDLVRIYDTGNHQVAMVIQAAKASGMKVFAGFNDPNDVESQIQAIIADVQNDWDSIHTVGVGNEAVQSGLISAGGAVAAVNTARTILRAAGYTGPVVIVENNAVLLQSGNSAICKNSDYTAANIHPWFDVNTPSEAAGAFVHEQVELIAANCGIDPSKLVVTETGWPWQGDSHGDNNRVVASPSDQNTAIGTLKSNFTDNMILFSAYDETWKQPEEYNSEHSWGFLFHNS